MAGLAALMKARGDNVSGCDLHPSPRTDWLSSLGVKVFAGHSPEHIQTAGGDVTAIVTPAVPAGNAEFAEARRVAHVRYRGEVLAEIVSAVDGIAVCGTHGKTTTSTFAAKLLAALGEDPGWCIGGETGAMPVASPGSAFAQDGGKRGPLVVEADESDGTLALYHPSTLVLNAVDFDHLEHFSGAEDYFDCYRKAIANTRSCVIVCADHPKALALACSAKRPAARLVTFGLGESPDLPAGAYASMHVCERDFPFLRSLVLGDHNVRNALAAAAVALSRGHSAAEIAEEMQSAVSSLPDRRFESVYSADGKGVRIFTDYAHHPAELRCAVEMAAAVGGKRVRAIFQPHRYSRTRALRDEFPPAFAMADEVVLVPVYPAFEEPVPGGDISDLYLAFREFENDGHGPRVLLSRSAEEAWRHVFLTLRPGDVVLIAGAGDIVHVVPAVVSDMRALPPDVDLDARASSETLDLSQFSFFRTGGVSYGRLVAEPADGRQSIVVGMGSNTWMSDLATDSDIVRLPHDSPAGRPGASILADHPGLSFMSGIPGTLGGWVKMNAGAFGHSIGEFVESVTLSDGRVLSHDECHFDYRSSSIDGLIVDVKFRRSESAAASTAEILAIRKRFPARCCGSVFKNPPGDAAGRLLEEAGAKKLSVGGAHVWEEHANVIFAEEGCTSSDILALARMMSLAVLHRFGIKLEPEIHGLQI